MLLPELADYLARNFQAVDFSESQVIYDDQLGKINLGELEETFSRTVIEMARKKYSKQTEFCQHAGLSPQLFTMMKANPTYLPHKNNAFACVIALELNPDEAEKLLKKASYTFSRSSLTDLIVRFFLEKGVYDINRINIVLDEYGQHPLGSL